MKKRAIHSLWVEKYRPIKLEKYASDPDTNTLLSRYIKEQDIDNLLLCGVNGTGKTSCAKLLVANVECDSLYINASSERGIDTVRDKIEGFASTMSMNNLKIIILDEADFLLPAAQAALRPIMELYSRSVRFILTCNYPDKIINPLKSRCTILHFNGIAKQTIAEISGDILENEGVEFDPQDLKTVINKYYPDIRKIIRVLQSHSDNNVLTLSDSLTNDVSTYDFILEQLIKPKKDSWVSIRQYIADNNIKTFESVYSYLYEEIEQFPAAKIPNVILTLAEAQYQTAFVIDKEITFMAAMAQILS